MSGVTGRVTFPKPAQSPREGSWCVESWQLLKLKTTTPSLSPRRFVTTHLQQLRDELALP
jgi:hypothetical protein